MAHTVIRQPERLKAKIEPQAASDARPAKLRVRFPHFIEMVDDGKRRLIAGYKLADILEE